MNLRIKWLAMIGALITLALNVAAIMPEDAPSDYENLQVLPKDISSKDLQSIMVDEFQDGLGVGCGYCHAQKKGSLKLDYASDEKPEKQIARVMMKMTMDINKRYFDVESPVIGSNALTVTCISCHHGTAHPEKE